MSSVPFSVVIPAAGASQRLGQAKQLVQLHGQSLLQRAVQNAAAISADEIIVITGAAAEFLPTESELNHVSPVPVHLVTNPDWRKGLGSSIALGARSVSHKSMGLMVLLCDQWRIEPADLQALIEVWYSDPHCLVASAYAEITGPPVIFPVSCFESLGQLQGDTGARKVMQTYANLLHMVTIKNAAADLDTPTDLVELEGFSGKP